VIECKIAIDL